MTKTELFEMIMNFDAALKKNKFPNFNNNPRLCGLNQGSLGEILDLSGSRRGTCEVD